MKDIDAHKTRSTEFYREVETVFLKVSMAITIFFGLLGLGIIIYQVWNYIDSSQWLPLSIISLLAYLNVEWALSPKKLLAVHQILDFIPLSLSLLGLALAQYLSGLIFMKKLKKILQLSM